MLVCGGLGGGIMYISGPLPRLCDFRATESENERRRKNEKYNERRKNESEREREGERDRERERERNEGGYRGWRYIHTNIYYLKSNTHTHTIINIICFIIAHFFSIFICVLFTSIHSMK